MRLLLQMSSVEKEVLEMIGLPPINQLCLELTTGSGWREVVVGLAPLGHAGRPVGLSLVGLGQHGRRCVALSLPGDAEFLVVYGDELGTAVGRDGIFNLSPALRNRLLKGISGPVITGTPFYSI